MQTLFCLAAGTFSLLLERTADHAEYAEKEISEIFPRPFIPFLRIRRGLLFEILSYEDQGEFFPIACGAGIT